MKTPHPFAPVFFASTLVACCGVSVTLAVASTQPLTSTVATQSILDSGGLTKGNLTGNVAAAESNPKDKGARDPSHFERPPNSIRTAYSMRQYPTLIQEDVKYASSSSSSELDSFYMRSLTSAGWQLAEMQENNGGPNDAHQIFRHWTNKDNGALDIYLIDLKPGLVEISLIVKRIPINGGPQS